ncbi:processed acidic surface protein [Planococcus shenhongbingii]|uniref:processed acidic surface protein n=1 Tax=Planococcus shenhongbingii TaxID=3058398 RepID=UPI002602FD2D|nr:processed acidic surface protein [Planococcus sp. N016]WKA57705.1 processed acidic surface protein [Planococcus sp. N016]
MKRLLLLALSAALIFAIFPGSAFAIEADSKEFDAFLKEIGWEKQDYIDYLNEKEYSLEEFGTVDELGTPLSEEAILPVLTKYELTRDELNDLLITNGDIEKDQDVLDGEYIIFSEDLADYVDFYMNEGKGTPITDESLRQFIEVYGFESKEELEEFLNEYDDSIENYETIEALEEAVDNYIFNSGFDLEGLFNELGLTSEEIERLETHLNTLPIETPAFQERASAIADRMMMIGEFDSADDLSAEEIAEIMDIFSDLLDLFDLNNQYFLVKGTDKKEINLSTLLALETLNGYNLLIEIYNTQGTFLADIILTAEMFGDEIIKETGKDIKEAEETVVLAPVAPAAPTSKTPATVNVPVKQTIQGGRLPDTASDYAANTFAGLTLALLGVVLFRRFKAQGI